MFYYNICVECSVVSTVQHQCAIIYLHFKCHISSRTHAHACTDTQKRVQLHRVSSLLLKLKKKMPKYITKKEEKQPRQQHQRQQQKRIAEITLAYVHKSIRIKKNGMTQTYTNASSTVSEAESPSISPSLKRTHTQADAKFTS